MRRRAGRYDRPVNFAEHPVIASLTPVFLLIGAGFLAGRRNWIRDSAVKDLSNLVFLLLIPSLLFRTMSAVRFEQLDLRPVVAKLFATHGEAWTQAAISSLKVGGSMLFTLLGLVVLVPVLAFYWLMDWAPIASRMDALVPPRWRESLGSLLDECDDVMGRYLRGQLLVMLSLAVFYSVGLLLFGFELALPIGVFTGLAVFIPYLGFGLGLVLYFASQGAGRLMWPVIGNITRLAVAVGAVVTQRKSIDSGTASQFDSGK